MRSQKTLFFPFSPGVPWKIKNGKYVVPELPVSCFMDVLKTRDAVVSAFGGFAESFYSLSILETINRTSPGTKLFWCGDAKYHHLLEVNGLAKPFNDVTQSDLDRFPTPIFFDKNDRAYFNCLNNYLDVQTYYLKHGYRDRRPVIQQIVEKSTIGWDTRYIPKLRHFEKPPDIDHYLRMYRLHVNGPFALLFPDSGGYSQHDVDCLGWELHHIRSAAAILQQRNIPLVLMTNDINRYAYSQAKIFPLRVDFAIYLMTKASAILSRSIDFPLVSFAISEAKVVSIEHKHEYNLLKNLHFIDCNNDIYTKEALSPIDVCNFITESKL